MSTKVGITGGIGSGKSVVSRLLEVMGVPVYLSDVESKRLTGTDPLIRRELCALLGNEVYRGNELNKTLLASYLFGHPDHARIVNDIIHPRVKADFRSWTAVHDSFPLVAMESAILIESGFASEVEVIVMVYAPLEVRVVRAVRRDHSSHELIMQRVRSQMCDEEKRAQAHFVLVNDGETPLIPQVLKLISFLSKNNHYLCPAKK